jgi:ABC-type Zn uptake system ZnuABC Zn-binding protein ZnuA
MLSDPNSSELKELIDEIKEEGITISFKEPQLDSSSLEYVSSEYNLEVLNLDPL